MHTAFLKTLAFLNACKMNECHADKLKWDVVDFRCVRLWSHVFAMTLRFKIISMFAIHVQHDWGHLRSLACPLTYLGVGPLNFLSHVRRHSAYKRLFASMSYRDVITGATRT